MHFCLTGQYTPQALKNIVENPATNRYEAAKNLTEAAGGKLISMYSTATDGPGVLVIIDVPDPSAAPAMTGILVESGALHHVSSRACGRRTRLSRCVKRQVSFAAHTSRPANKCI